MSAKGIEYLQKFEPRKALPLLRKSALKEPSYDHLVNLAVAERGCGMILEAKETLMRALKLDQKRPEAWHNMGQCCEDLGEFENCAQMFKRTLECIEAAGTPPHSAGDSLLSFAYALLRLGHFKYVWPIWETARVNRTWWLFTNLHPWKGEPDARLLVLPEGGFGDAFNFLRWIPRIVALGLRPTIMVWDPMFEYVKHVFRNAPAQVLPLSHKFQYGELARFTHCTPYLSLMTGFSDWNEIPAPLDWEPRGRIVAPPNDWIGFAWRAEENGVMRKIRTLDKQAADAIGKHLARNCERVVSLCPAGKSLYRQGDESTPKGVTQDESLLGDWEHTALTVLKCRLVVTVDTAVAHLAGSLGVPTLILNPLRSDWKYQIGTETTAWYGRNVKQFRNENPVSWDVERIKKAVDSF